MSKDPDSLYFNREEEFWEDFRRFKELTGSSEWEVRNARKDQPDALGGTIRERQDYFFKQVGPGWGDAWKVSRLSMETVLAMFLPLNPRR